MAFFYLFDADGFFRGTYDGEVAPPNSTMMQPTYGESSLPRFVNGEWVDTDAPPVVSAADFPMLFTAPEEIAIKRLVTDAPDGVTAVLWSRLTRQDLLQVDLGLKSVQSLLSSLQAEGVLTADRVAEVLRGELQ